VGTVYIILQQIYSGNSVPNLIRIARVLWEILQKNVFFFLDTVYFGYLRTIKLASTCISMYDYLCCEANLINLHMIAVKSNCMPCACY